MAKAEQTFGLGKDLPQFVFVTIGMGIGCAIFVDGHLYEGADGLAGEFGHMTVEENGNLCTCGNRGCLELYSSASAIVGRVRAELGHGVGSSLGSEFGDHLDELTVEKIVAAAQAHDRLAERVITEAGMHLGTALAGIVNLLNPRKIILGGRVPQAASELFLSPLLYNLRHRALPQAVEKLEISVSQLGEESAALGAVLMTREIVLAARCREVSGSISMTNGVRPPEGHPVDAPVRG
jgi:predicted NBD/HSP70 family sugar kinase